MWIARTIEAGIVCVYDCAIFLLLRGMGIEARFGEVRKRAYRRSDTIPGFPIDPAQAEFVFRWEREGSDHTDDKTKQLLALSSSLVTVVLVFANDAKPVALLILVMALLLAVVILCVAVLGVRTSSTPTLEDSTNPHNQKIWAKDLVIAASINAAGHRFRVDCYRTAARYLLLALLLTPVLAALSKSKPDTSAELLQVLEHVERNGLPVRPIGGHMTAPDVASPHSANSKTSGAGIPPTDSVTSQPPK